MFAIVFIYLFDFEKLCMTCIFSEELLPIQYFKAACSVPISEETSEGAVRFLQTDRDGNSRGLVALDPRELLM